MLKGDILIKFNDSNIDRFLNVLKGEIPDRIPYFDFWFSKKIISAVLEKELVAEETNENNMIYPDLISINDYIDFIYAIGQDLTGFLLLSPDNYKLKGGEEIIKNVDIISNQEKFKKIEFPNLDNYIKEHKNRYEKMYLKAKKLNIGLTIPTGVIFQDSHQLIGFNNFMIKVNEDMSFIEDVMDFFTEIYYNLAKFICSLDIPVFFYADNIAYNNGPFLNEKLFKKIYYPRMKKVLEPALNKGLPIMFDSDGDIEWLIDDLIEFGVNAIQPIDPGGMDIYRIKEKYGNRITIMGNVGQDFPLSTGNIDDVQQDVKHRINILGKSGRYVLKSSHDIGENVKIENFIEMIKTLHKFGYYN